MFTMGNLFKLEVTKSEAEGKTTLTAKTAPQNTEVEERLHKMLPGLITSASGKVTVEVAVGVKENSYSTSHGTDLRRNGLDDLFGVARRGLEQLSEVNAALQEMSTESFDRQVEVLATKAVTDPGVLENDVSVVIVERKPCSSCGQYHDDVTEQIAKSSMMRELLKPLGISSVQLVNGDELDQMESGTIIVTDRSGRLITSPFRGAVEEMLGDKATRRVRGNVPSVFEKNAQALFSRISEAEEMIKRMVASFETDRRRLVSEGIIVDTTTQEQKALLARWSETQPASLVDRLGGTCVAS